MSQSVQLYFSFLTHILWGRVDPAQRPGARGDSKLENDPVEDTLSSSSDESESFPTVPGGDLSRIGGAEGYSWFEMIPFWRAYRPWLAARGFHIFEPRYGQGSYGYELPPPTQSPAALPYARFIDIEIDPSISNTPPPKFAPARDSLTRDVMIKLVKKDSDEYRIYQDLQGCSAVSGNALRGVIPPVAILDSQYDFSFIVMPRWGNYTPLADFQTVGGVVSLIRSLLKGLAFLHSRRIVHRDIDFHNIMVNCYTFGPFRDEFRRALEKHRQGPDASHCLMDFDRSLKFPLDTPLDACRLPADESLVSATPFQPFDLSLAEHDYDPFAFDVGCLGAIFQLNYAEMVPVVPMLAPLFDQMTTHVVSERFKAAGALAFFEDVAHQLPSDVLSTEVKLVQSWDPVDDPNVYWSKLPPDFCKMPGLYRTPPPSLVRRILTVIARYSIGWRILLFVRSVLRV
ncbi:hypothetical protein GSI_04477 [Ganoderma sinense ZZ0214-1]|uniref:Protein kinase domain-containing protein n=1 Tax=Ganoderma sinense ZZ0214-1 TaxID=1077348 RepID=A0A2G8SHI8_9APHY|nr:hypothetical protein GSI_04477 [Ganoderma sinense ZZ0214-1]